MKMNWNSLAPLRPSLVLACARFKVLWLVCAAIFGVAAPVQAAPVRVRGIVLNATKFRPATGVRVELLRPAQSASSGTLMATAQTDAQGRFDFGPREVAADDLLIARVVYQGFSYLTTAFDGGQKLKAMGINIVPRPDATQMQIYDASSRPPQLKFTVHHLAIESSEKGLKCIERIVVENPSRATFIGIGPSKGTVLLDVPKGARELKMDAKIPGKLIQTSHGWMATTPIMPASYVSQNPLAGPNALIFSYFMDWPSVLPWARRVDLSQRILYPTNFFFVARTTADKGLQVTAPQLSPDNETQLTIDRENQARIVNSLGQPMSQTPALKAQERVAVQVSRAVNPLFWAFLSFIIVMCVAVPLALRGARRPRPVNGDQSTLDNEYDAEYESAASASGVAGAAAAAPLMLSAELKRVVDAMARLDDDYEAGRIARLDYENRRARHKEQALALSAQNDGEKTLLLK